MQLVRENRLHTSQVGAVGSSLGSCPRDRRFEFCTCHKGFLKVLNHKYVKRLFLAYLVWEDRVRLSLLEGIIFYFWGE